MPSLLDMALANHSHYNVSSGSHSLPTTLLEAVFPGSSLLANFLLALGVDASLLVSWVAILAAAWAAVRFGLVFACDSIVRTFSSFVVVEEYDPIYHHVLSWASARKNLQDIRSLRAQTAGQYYEAFGDHEEEDDNHQLQLRENLSEDTIFNFNSWSARAPPQYRPHQSTGWFFHDYRLFRLHRTRDRVSSEIGLVFERERMDISVLWMSPKPIKHLIEEAREFVLARRTSTTTIKRPTTKSQRSGRHQAWTTIANRPSRSMATVVLDNEQKASILRDFNEFLHPRTARWYSNRGIPYRRGYLFYGPPGTGKTSLSFALAGVFGLDIYSLALSEASLTEEDLILLFNSLPKRCILLLEDVDTAGLGRAPGTKRAAKHTPTKQSSSGKNKEKTNTPVAPNEDEGEVQRLVTSQANTVDMPNATTKEATFKNTITLSGLLNAVDGVASQEGRVLIMTTNHLERLDQALTRPGRVDLIINFNLANTQQIKDLFIRMYVADTLEMTRQPTKISHILPNQDKSGYLNGQAISASTDSCKGLTMHDDNIRSLAPTDISRLAQEFADALPALTFSPAEIQGFLLVRKKDPRQAVADVAAWRDEQMQKKSNMTANTKSDSVSPATDIKASTEKTASQVDGEGVSENRDTSKNKPVGLSVDRIESQDRVRPETPALKLADELGDSTVADGEAAVKAIRNMAKEIQEQGSGIPPQPKKIDGDSSAAAQTAHAKVAEPDSTTVATAISLLSNPVSQQQQLVAEAEFQSPSVDSAEPLSQLANENIAERETNGGGGDSKHSSPGSENSADNEYDDSGGGEDDDTSDNESMQADGSELGDQDSFDAQASDDDDSGGGRVVTKFRWFSPHRGGRARRGI